MPRKGRVGSTPTSPTTTARATLLVRAGTANILFDQGVIKNVLGTAVQNDVNIVGSGRENLDSAVKSWVTLDPVSVSFGAGPSRSGQTLGYSVRIKNESGSSHTFNLAVSGGRGGVSFSLGQSSITLAGGATGTFTVWMSSLKGAALGGHQGTLTISGSSVTYAHAVLYTLVR